MAGQIPAPKRNVLKITARMYDPLGLISPVIIQLKMMFQELCPEKAGWDELLNEDQLRRWKAWVADTKMVGEIEVPRCFFHSYKDNPESVELHGFSDASNSAYAAVVYLKSATHPSTVHLVACKTRVAPLSLQSIPRLELLGALILARLITHVKDVIEREIHVSSMNCWCDSMVTLYWITGEQRVWKQFVQNRVDEICSPVPRSCWTFCPGSCYPADIPSRGMKASEICQNVRWWNGPEWFCLPKASWPGGIGTDSPPAESLPEMKAEPRNLQESNTNMTCTEHVSISILISVERFCSALKFFRVTAYLLRFIGNIKARLGGKERLTGELSEEESQRAEKMWICDLQSTFNQKKLDEVQGTLGPFVDTDGILRCKGRLQHAKLPYTARFPAYTARSLSYEIAHPAFPRKSNAQWYQRDVGRTANTVLGHKGKTSGPEGGFRMSHMPKIGRFTLSCSRNRSSTQFQVKSTHK